MYILGISTGASCGPCPASHPSFSHTGCWCLCSPVSSGGLFLPLRTIPIQSHSLCSFYFNQEVIKFIHSLKTVEKVSKKAHSPSGVGMEGGPGERRTWHPDGLGTVLAVTMTRPSRERLTGRRAGRALSAWLSLPACSYGVGRDPKTSHVARRTWTGLGQAQRKPRPGLDSVSKSTPAGERLCFRCPFGHPVPEPAAVHTCLHCPLPRAARSQLPHPRSPHAAPLDGLSQGTDLHGAVHGS